MELGIYTFAETTPDPRTGRTIGPRERLADLLEEIALADELGLDVFGVGEHHRPDFAVSAPAVVLAAAAARTKRIRLTSAVSVLSSDDPVRVFQNFATLDLLSGGRAEIMAGRGSFVESFPLFGYDLDDYDELFSEKLELLLALRESDHVVWSGRHRAPLDGQGVYPRPVQHPLPVWVAVGGPPRAGLGRVGRPAAVGRARRRARPADGARDHRRPARAVRPVRRAAPPSGRGGRASGAGAVDQLARLHRGHVAGGDGRGVRRAQGRDGQDRPRARLAADDPRAVRRGGGAARRELRRQPAAGDREGPLPARDLRPPALP